MKKWLYGIMYIAVVVAFSMIFSYTYIKLNSKSSVFIEHINIDDVPPTLYKGEDEPTEVVEEPPVEEPTVTSEPGGQPIQTPTPTNTPIPPRPTPSSTPVSTPTATPTVAPTQTPNTNPSVTNYREENIKISNKIANEYGITVKYGNDIKNYTVSDMTINPITDEKAVNTYLNTVYNNLKLYPNGMFREVSDYGFRLSFYLIHNFSTENVAGVTEQRNLNVIISISTDYDFIETLNHELYHYFDAYMDALGNTNPMWNSLNPSDFTYGQTNSNYSFFSTYRINSYFINDYAQTDDYEDRAVVFEYMMASYELKCFETGTPTYKKARLISETLDNYFSSVTSSNTEYWERYIS